MAIKIRCYKKDNKELIDKLRKDFSTQYGGEALAEVDKKSRGVSEGMSVHSVAGYTCGTSLWT